MSSSGATLRFDRVISDELLNVLTNGPLSGLAAMRNNAPDSLDLQLRRDAWGTRSWASLYVGLSSVLDINEDKGAFWLGANATYSGSNVTTSPFGFDPGWRSRCDKDQLVRSWPAIKSYLENVIPAVKPMFTHKEGRVHSLMCSGLAQEYQIINREASPSFPKGSAATGARQQLIDDLATPIWSALPSSELAPSDKTWWKESKVIGTSPDLLGVDPNGDLLIIEAKWAGDHQRTPWGPPQLAFYAALWARAIRDNKDAHGTLTAMLGQRAALGHSQVWPIRRPVRIVPILAIGNGVPTREVLRRVLIVQRALDSGLDYSPSVRPTEIWLVDDKTGDPLVRI